MIEELEAIVVEMGSDEDGYTIPPDQIPIARALKNILDILKEHDERLQP